MIYTELTVKAMRLAYEAHEGQFDKAGVPYIFHPIHLAEQMQTEYGTVAALLHDVPEDSKYSLEDLAAMGFPEPVLHAISLLTHKPGVPYMDYVAGIKTDKLATAVKLVDLKHNSDKSRLPKLDERDIKRIEKYRRAIALLSE